jgi:site-specific recombinase XerD
MIDNSNNLTQYNHSSISTNLELIAQAKEFARSAYANNTISSYKKDWQNFQNWCIKENLTSLPCSIDALILYITALTYSLNRKTSTIQRHICSINKVHLMANHSLNLKDSSFLLVWNGIKRKQGLAKTGKSPLLLNHLRQIVEKIEGKSNLDIRDRALILFGWASAMRRSEIVALNWQDIEFIEEGMLVNIRQSKTDQYGLGQKIAIVHGKYEETCSIRNLKKWQKISQDNTAVFTSINKADQINYTRLSDRDIARIVKKHLSKIGMDSTGFAGHSLRSGFITTAAKHSVPDRVIMKHTRHKSIQMLQVYTRDNSLIQDNATSMVGL